MEAPKLRLPRIQDLIRKEYDSKKRPINYANYTNESYNILTLENHNDYYKSYKKKLPAYTAEQPDWSKSLYKRKTNKIDKYNYLMYRNARNVRNMSRKSRECEVPRSLLYRTVDKMHRGQSSGTVPFEKKSGTKSVLETLPLIRNKRGTQSNASALSKRSLSLYSKSNKKKSVMSEAKGSNKLRRSQQLIKRAERLGKFLQGIKSEEGKELVRAYGKRLVESLNVSDITKERMKIAIETPAEDIQRILESALGVQLDEADDKETDNKKETNSRKETDDKKEVYDKKEEGEEVSESGDARR
eukprot:TRINITY_DN17725_c0_g1_i1.p1 TRINITY_DN17725_c0_g1~~TRINITY_DN17725_c0_g1_i1.p1  ORF type:complete len:300 (-),score=80.37 TRINITY_DN17725_c0_g1_i1:237-1136(-)